MLCGLRLSIPNTVFGVTIRKSNSASSPQAGSTQSRSSRTPSVSSRSSPNETSRPYTVNDFISRAREAGPDFNLNGSEGKAYARYLGIDPVENQHLLWIAMDCIKAPLPAFWSEHFDTHGRIFFYNESEGVSTWIHPLEENYRETYKSIVAFQCLTSEEQIKELCIVRDKYNQSRTHAETELKEWSMHHDDGGNTFYYHHRNKLSTWTNPQPALHNDHSMKRKALMEIMRISLGSKEIEQDLLSDDNDLPPLETEEIQLTTAAVGDCVVCLNAIATHVVVPCGHQAFCETCAKTYQEQRSKCPCCRERILQIIKVYVPAPRQRTPEKPQDSPVKEEKVEKDPDDDHELIFV